MLSRALLAVVVLMGCSESLQAQGVRRPAQPGAANMQPTDIEGFIEGVMQGGMIVLDKNNQRWQVAVPPMAKVQVTGEANADYLQTGMFVEFKADIDEQGAINEKADKLAIITILQEKQMGLFDPGSSDDQKGFGPDAGTGGAKQAKRGSGKNAVAGTYRVVGKLMIGRNGKMMVNTGRGSFAFELTQQPEITVNVADYTVAKKGDKVTIKGGTMPNRAGMAQASEVKIELSEPLAGVKKKGPPAKSDGKRSPKRPKKEEGLPEPAVDK